MLAGRAVKVEAMPAYIPQVVVLGLQFTAFLLEAIPKLSGRLGFLGRYL